MASHRVCFLFLPRFASYVHSPSRQQIVFTQLNESGVCESDVLIRLRILALIIVLKYQQSMW